MEASVGTIFDSKNREVWLDERASNLWNGQKKKFFFSKNKKSSTVTVKQKHRRQPATHHPSHSDPLGFDMRGPEFTETPASYSSFSKSCFSTKMSYKFNTTVLLIVVLALFISEINSRSSFNCGLTCYR